MGSSSGGQMEGRFQLIFRKGDEREDRKALVPWRFHHVDGRREAGEQEPGRCACSHRLLLRC